MKNNTATNNTSNGTVTLALSDFTPASAKARIKEVLRGLNAPFVNFRNKATNDDIILVTANNLAFSFKQGYLSVWYATGADTSTDYFEYAFIKEIDAMGHGLSLLQISSIVPGIWSSFNVQ